jgi:SAM-dependent methyltransferase
MARAKWQWGDDYIECRYPGSKEMARKQIPGIISLMHLDTPSKILDCPCGWGRYSNPLAELGHDVTGIDFTEKFIEMARKEAPEQNPPRYKVGDMRELCISGRFDAVINLLGSFGYYGEKTDSLILAGFLKALKPGGRLMIDQYNREKLRDLPKTITRKLPGGKLWVLEQRMDSKKGVYSLTDTIRDGSSVRKYEFSMRWYSVAEYQKMLAKHSVDSVELYGDFDGSSYTPSSERQIVVAQRCAGPPAR